jgi:nucleoside-diphosphate-sugar epimerase
MRVLIAGATGAIGSRLVPLLTAAGHDVIGLPRSRSRAAVAERAGVEVMVADALDRPAVDRAVGDTAPDAVVHLLTAIPAEINPRRMARDFALTNSERRRPVTCWRRPTGARSDGRSPKDSPTFTTRA